jgi:hypothetical protein
MSTYGQEPQQPEPVWDDFTIRWIVELGLCGYRPKATPEHAPCRCDPAAAPNATPPSLHPAVRSCEGMANARG